MCAPLNFIQSTVIYSCRNRVELLQNSDHIQPMNVIS